MPRLRLLMNSTPACPSRGHVYHNWKKAQNCVAKRYMKKVKKEVYLADVLVQMDAKFL